MKISKNKALGAAAVAIFLVCQQLAYQDASEEAPMLEKDSKQQALEEKAKSVASNIKDYLSTVARIELLGHEKAQAEAKLDQLTELLDDPITQKVLSRGFIDAVTGKALTVAGGSYLISDAPLQSYELAEFMGEIGHADA